MYRDALGQDTTTAGVTKIPEPFVIKTYDNVTVTSEAE